MRVIRLLLGEIRSLKEVCLQIFAGMFLPLFLQQSVGLAGNNLKNVIMTHTDVLTFDLLSLCILSCARWDSKKLMYPLTNSIISCDCGQNATSVFYRLCSGAGEEAESGGCLQVCCK